MGIITRHRLRPRPAPRWRPGFRVEQPSCLAFESQHAVTVCPSLADTLTALCPNDGIIRLTLQQDPLFPIRSCEIGTAESLDSSMEIFSDLSRPSQP